MIHFREMFSSYIFPSRSVFTAKAVKHVNEGENTAEPQVPNHLCLTLEAKPFTPKEVKVRRIRIKT